MFKFKQRSKSVAIAINLLYKQGNIDHLTLSTPNLQRLLGLVLLLGNLLLCSFCSRMSVEFESSEFLYFMLMTLGSGILMGVGITLLSLYIRQQCCCHQTTTSAATPDMIARPETFQLLPTPSASAPPATTIN